MTDDAFVEVPLPPFKQLARVGYWRAAWMRRSRWRKGRTARELDLDNFMVTQQWEMAFDQVELGDWEELERILYCVDAHVPPPPLWPKLTAFFANPPKRKRGPPAAHPDVVRSIRSQYDWLRKPHLAERFDPDVGVIRYQAKGMTAKQAKHVIADRMREDGARIGYWTVHKIVTRTAEYAWNEWPWEEKNSPTRGASV